MKSGALCALALLTQNSMAKNFLPYHGVNLAGMDFHINTSGFVEFAGAKPTIPLQADVSAWLALNATLFRIPVGWNYLQPTGKFPSTTLDSTTMGQLDSVVNRITQNTSRDVYAIIDVHNYARYNGNIVGQGSASDSRPYDYDLENLWKLLAIHYQGNSHVMFGLMNERQRLPLQPYTGLQKLTSSIAHDLNVSIWAETTKRVIQTIRNISSNQYILISAPPWQELSSWTEVSKPYLQNVTDPANKLLFDVHQYFDHKGGNTGNCSDFDSTYRSGFGKFVAAMESLNAQAILTEFGGSNNSWCRDTIEDMLSFMEANPTTFFGWTAWGQGLSPDEHTYISVSTANASLSHDSAPSLESILVWHMMSEGTSYLPNMLFFVLLGFTVAAYVNV